MKILAIDSSATAASAALCEDELVLGESFLHTAKTHSQTLLPMTERLLTACDTMPTALDLFAVTTGPGSFTGLRIAIAAVKGMAMAAEKPCVGVSSLLALACGLRGFSGVAAAVMDARCGQVYTAVFELRGGGVTRRTEDMAISIEQLGEMLAGEKKDVFLVGDGAQLCYNNLLDRLPTLRLAPEHLRYCRASSVAFAALEQYRLSGAVSAGELLPGYLRLPQAQRELLKKQSGMT